MTTLASGLGSSLGLAKETTYGTVVTPNRFFEFDSETLARQQAYQDSVGLKAGRMFQPAGRSVQTTRAASGAIPMDVPTKSFSAILDLMHGLVPTFVQQAATTAYLATHLIGTSVPNKSATLQVNKPDTGGNDRAFTYPGSILTQVDLSCDVGGLLKCTLTWDSQDELNPGSTPAGPALTTPSYASGIVGFNHTMGTVTVAGSAVAVCKSFNLSWTQPYDIERRFLAATALKAKPIPNGFQTLTGNLALEFADMTHYNIFAAASMNAIVLDFVGGIIASTYHDEFKLTIDQGQYRGDSPNVTGPGLLELAVPFSAFDGGSNAPLTAALTTTDVAV